MKTVIRYIKRKVVFRHHWRKMYIPVYNEEGKGGPRDKATKEEVDRET